VSQRPSTAEALLFAFRKVPSDIGLPLLGGTVLAALLVVLLPDNLAASLPGGVLGAYVAISLFALPLYICSTGAIPLAAGLIQAGWPPGAAFILLVAGPAVSAASLATLSKLIGTRSTAVCCIVILAVTWSIAALLDFTALSQISAACHATESAASPLAQFSAAMLLLLLGAARLRVRW
jgi:hypothetical protein